MMRELKLYPIRLGMLRRSSIYVRITMPDGCIWAIPGKLILDNAQRYYEIEGWDDESEYPKDHIQPTGEELRGIMEANSDYSQWAKECFWSEVESGAIHLAGPRTIPPRNDKLWWFDENGGKIEEMTTISHATGLSRSPVVVRRFESGGWTGS
jgi:hypothetical protein